jgi:hypothetical protein
MVHKGKHETFYMFNLLFFSVELLAPKTKEQQINDLLPSLHFRA